MTATILKGVCAVLILAVIFLLGMCFVNLRTIDNLTGRNAELSAALLAIDLKAKADILKYQENLNAIQDKSERDRADIAAYYKRLYEKLRKDNNSTSTIADGAESVDGTTGQQTIARCDIEIERRCVEDALRVQETTEFFRVNNFPTE